jgi:7-cyano-7-deazaguanine synthase
MGEGRGAICLTSGGVDSVVTAYYVTKVLKASPVELVFVDYGQRTAEEEGVCVRDVSRALSVPLRVVDLKWLGALSTSLLTRRDVAIPETPVEELNDPVKARERILRWWDVVRNLQLVVVGLAHAESRDLRSYLEGGGRRVSDVYIGIRRETPVAMKDNTPEFIEEMNRVAEVSTHFGGYRVLAPLIGYDKDAVVRLGQELGVDWLSTYSCYAGGLGYARVDGRQVPIHCGRCSNCRRRFLAFRQASILDPSVYARPPLGEEERPTCPYCGSRFEDSLALSKHIDAVHVGPGLLKGDTRKW